MMPAPTVLGSGCGKPLDIDTLTEYVAQRCGLGYLRIDPLRVDVGKVSDTMAAR